MFFWLSFLVLRAPVTLEEPPPPLPFFLPPRSPPRQGVALSPWGSLAPNSLFFNVLLFLLSPNFFSPRRCQTPGGRFSFASEVRTAEFYEVIPFGPHAFPWLVGKFFEKIFLYVPPMALKTFSVFPPSQAEMPFTPPTTNFFRSDFDLLQLDRVLPKTVKVNLSSFSHHFSSCARYLSLVLSLRDLFHCAFGSPNIPLFPFLPRLLF